MAEEDPEKSVYGKRPIIAYSNRSGSKDSTQQTEQTKYSQRCVQAEDDYRAIK